MKQETTFGRLSCLVFLQFLLTTASAQVTVTPAFDKVLADGAAVSFTYKCENGDSNSQVYPTWTNEAGEVIQTSSGGANERVYTSQSMDPSPSGLLAVTRLTFKNAKITEDGAYTCAIGADEEERRVIVTIPISFPVRAAEESQRLLIENNGRVTCTINSNPFPAIYWRLNGQLIDTNNPDDRFSMTTQMVTEPERPGFEQAQVAILEVQDVIAADAGSYECFATVETTGDSDTLTIAVQVQAVPCANPPPLSNGLAAYSDDVYAIYACDPGYLMDVERDTAVLLCNASSGAWSGALPDCNRIQCPDAAVPNFGSVEGSGRYYGDNITFSCGTNYRLLDPTVTSVCTQYGSWSKETPECLPDLANPDVCPPAGWNYKNRTCFLAYEGNEDFGPAAGICASGPLYGQLAKIPDQSTQDFLVQNLQGRDDYYWIGVFEGLKWYLPGSDSEMQYFAWATGQPNGPLDESNCIQLRQDFSSEFDDYDWHDLDCRDTEFFICEFEQACPVTDPDLVGYTHVSYGDNCAVFVEREYRWSDARNYCSDNGGRMVEIITEVLQHLLAYVANSKVVAGPYPNWWIGGFRDPDQPDGELLFLDGPAVTNTFWAPGEPNGRNEKCINLHHKENFGWNDDDCGGIGGDGYICQYPGKRGPLKCSDPGTPAHGTSNSSHADWLFGSYVTFSCDVGYELEGSDRIDCGQNGTYSDVRPKCTPVSCDSLFPTLPNSDPYPPNKTEYRSVAVYLCRLEYYPNGDVTSVCQADGRWSQPTGSCEDIPETTPFMSTESGSSSPDNSTTTPSGPGNSTTPGTVTIVPRTTVTLLPPDSTPQDDGTITLQCGYFSMTVTIPLTLVGGVTSGEDLHLELDGNCMGMISDDENFISITTNLTDCGNTIEVYDAQIVYSNTVVERTTDGSISRLPQVYVPFSCSYNRSAQVRVRSYQITNYQLNLTEASTGKYAFSLDVFKDEDFEEKYADAEYPVDVQLNEDLYFGASVPTQDGTLDLSIRSCVATPSASYNDVQWKIIQDGCAIETSTHIDGDHGFVGVTMNTFRFVDLGTRVYILCDLVVCRATTGNETSECDPACVGTSDNRARRDVIKEYSLGKKRIMKGPLRLRGGANKEQRFDGTFESSKEKPSPTHNFDPWFMTFIAMTTICILIISVLFIFLRTMTSYEEHMKLRTVAEKGTRDTILKT